MSEREELANDLRDEAEAHHADGQHGFAAKLERAAAYIASQAEYVRGLEDAEKEIYWIIPSGQMGLRQRCIEAIRALKNTAQAKESSVAQMILDAGGDMEKVHALMAAAYDQHTLVLNSDLMHIASQCESRGMTELACQIRTLQPTAQAGQNAAGSNGPSRPGRVASHPEPAAAPVADSQARSGTDAAFSGGHPSKPAESAFVRVPREPTDEMLRAGWNAYLEDMKGGLGRFALTYRAMLSAAPAPAVDEEAVRYARSFIQAEDESRNDIKDVRVSHVMRAYLLAVGRKP